MIELGEVEGSEQVEGSDFCWGCIHDSCFFFSSRFLNTPKIFLYSAGQADSCKGKLRCQ